MISKNTSLYSKTETKQKNLNLILESGCSLCYMGHNKNFSKENTVFLKGSSTTFLQDMSKT